MFMVMIVHAVMVIGLPSANEISIYPLKSFVGVLIESLSIICVNVYILISGFCGTFVGIFLLVFYKDQDTIKIGQYVGCGGFCVLLSPHVSFFL